MVIAVHYEAVCAVLRQCCTSATPRDVHNDVIGSLMAALMKINEKCFLNALCIGGPQSRDDLLANVLTTEHPARIIRAIDHSRQTNDGCNI